MSDRIPRALGPARVALWSLAACVAAWSLQSQAAGVNFEGTWKISALQASFKPEGGAVPFTAKGKQAYDSNKRYYAAGQFGEYDITQSRCSSPGTPRLMLTPMRFRVYQRSGLLHISYEWNRVNRMIELPDFWKPGGQQGSGSFGDDRSFGSMEGDSQGRWDGDTLVVTTINFTDKTLIDNLVPHGYDLKVTERISLKDRNTLEDRITVEDPEYFTKPWSTAVTYTRQADVAFAEDTCLDRRDAGELPLPRS
jgi:hypothetical protein